MHFGRFGLRWLVSSVIAIPPDRENPHPRLGVEEGGLYAAEALVLARYFMFAQVYFHKTRAAYDIHLRGVTKHILPGGLFPKPTGAEVNEFLKWDDWRVMGLIRAGRAGEHGRRILERNHYRSIHHTPEVCTQKDMLELKKAKERLGRLVVAEERATKSWYKSGSDDIPVLSKVRTPQVQPLSEYSKVIAGMMERNNQVLLYVDPASREEAEMKLKRRGNQQR